MWAMLTCSPRGLAPKQAFDFILKSFCHAHSPAIPAAELSVGCEGEICSENSFAQELEAGVPVLAQPLTVWFQAWLSLFFHAV